MSHPSWTENEKTRDAEKLLKQYEHKEKIDMWKSERNYSTTYKKILKSGDEIAVQKLLIGGENQCKTKQRTGLLNAAKRNEK